MAETVEILRIEVDNESAQKALVTYEQRLVALKKEQTAFRKALIESNGTNKKAAEGLVRVTKEVQSNTAKRKELTKAVNTESNIRLARILPARLTALLYSISTLYVPLLTCSIKRLIPLITSSSSKPVITQGLL